MMIEERCGKALIDLRIGHTGAFSPVEEVRRAVDVPAGGVSRVTALAEVAPQGLSAGGQLLVSTSRAEVEIKSMGRVHGGLLQLKPPQLHASPHFSQTPGKIELVP